MNQLLSAPSKYRDQVSRSERVLVFIGGFILTFIAGYVNVILINYYQLPVSHMSGVSSRLGADLALGNMNDFLLIISIIFSFFAGAVLSGVIIGNIRLRPGRRYGVSMMIEGGLLFAAGLLLSSNYSMGAAVAAFACGMQNAMATSYYGLVLRTTHVTGIVTDIGIIVGGWLRNRKIKKWKLFVLLILLLGFIVGSFTGVAVSLTFKNSALYLAALLSLVSGMIYFIWRHFGKVNNIR